MLPKGSNAKYGLLAICFLASIIFLVKNFSAEDSSDSTKKRSVQKHVGSHLYSFETSIISASPNRSQISYSVSLPNSAEIVAFEFVASDSVTRERLDRSLAEQQTVGGIINLHRHDEIAPTLDYYMHPVQVAYNEKSFHSVSAEIRLLDGVQIDGQIMSPGYPDHYPNGADITWLFSSDVGFLISFQVTYYSTEECCDRLTVYDGASTQSAVLGIFAGTSIGETPSSITLESSGPSLLAKFTSDCLTAGEGFRAFYSIHKAPVTTTPMTTTEAQPTVTLLQNQTGYIQSPNYPQTYPEISEYYWLISPNMTVSNVSIMLEDFNTKENVDVLYIYDGDSTSSLLLNAISGDEFLGFLVTGTQSTMLLHFVTGRNIESYPYRGFSLQYFVSSPPCDGGIYLLQEHSGMITSPNFPYDYPENSNCIWSIQTETGTAVVFEIISFHIERSYDGVYFFDGLYDPAISRDDYLYYLDGDIAKGFKVTASGNRAYMQFISDYSVQEQGFEIQYAGVVLENNQCEGDKTLDDNSGYVTSPFYPLTYVNDLNCLWTIVVSSGNYIKLEVQDFQSEFGRDVLFVFDSSVADFGYLLADFTGSMPAGFSVNSSSNVAVLEFITDVDMVNRGFNITYTALSGNPTPPTTIPDSVAGDPCSGGQYITGTSGHIDSPGYPNGYNDNLDCGWWVRGPVSQVLVFSVVRFFLESRYDYLQIIDGNGTQLVEWTSEILTSTTVTTTSNLAFLWFHTDPSIDRIGFSLDFSAESPGSGSGSGDGRVQKNNKDGQVVSTKQVPTRQQRIREKWGPRLEPKPKISTAENTD